MQKLHIAILVGTTRENRLSIHAAHVMKQVADTYDTITTELVDPKDFTFNGDGKDPEAKDAKYTAITAKADGFLIVVPEYNHSFPGSLKRMLDSELENYMHKPVAFAGVSNGNWGGVRAIESLVNVVRTMGLVATSRDMQFARIQDFFNEDGTIADETYLVHARGCIDELIWMATTLKYGRTNAAD